MERTYIMTKPDAYQRGLVGEVITRIENKGYKRYEDDEFRWSNFKRTLCSSSW